MDICKHASPLLDCSVKIHLDDGKIIVDLGAIRHLMGRLIYLSTIIDQT